MSNELKRDLLDTIKIHGLLDKIRSLTRFSNRLTPFVENLVRSRIELEKIQQDIIEDLKKPPTEELG